MVRAPRVSMSMTWLLIRKAFLPDTRVWPPIQNATVRRPTTTKTSSRVKPLAGDLGCALMVR